MCNCESDPKLKASNFLFKSEKQNKEKSEVKPSSKKSGDFIYLTKKRYA